MRLIDADVLKETYFYPTNTKNAPVLSFISLEEINNVPTIEAEPVRHGRWEMKPDPYGFFGEIPVCSECGCTTKMRDKTKFCPHCGARMDGGGDDGNG